MRSNVVLDHNSPRRRNVLNPNINPMSNDSLGNAQTFLGVLSNLSENNGSIDPAA